MSLFASFTEIPSGLYDTPLDTFPQQPLHALVQFLVESFCHLYHIVFRLETVWDARISEKRQLKPSSKDPSTDMQSFVSTPASRASFS